MLSVYNWFLFCFCFVLLWFLLFLLRSCTDSFNIFYMKMACSRWNRELEYTIFIICFMFWRDGFRFDDLLMHWINMFCFACLSFTLYSNCVVKFHRFVENQTRWHFVWFSSIPHFKWVRIFFKKFSWKIGNREMSDLKMRSIDRPSSPLIFPYGIKQLATQIHTQVY